MGKPIRPRALHLVLVLATAAWVALVFAAFCPGLMSNDSFIELELGMARSYTNQHPPAHTALVGLAVRAFGSPWPLLLIDLVVIGGAMALLVKRSGEPASLALWVVFLLLPPVWGVANTIWKDVAMSGFLLIAVVALAWKRPLLAATSLVAATLMRHNAVFAAIPLLIPAAAQALPKWENTKRWLAVAAGSLLLLAAPSIAERAFGAQHICLVCGMAEYDLAGVYVADPTGYESSVLAPYVGIDELRKSYRHDTNGFMLNYISEQRMFELLDAVPEWRAALRRHPLIVAGNKLRTFAYLMGLGPAVVYPFHTDLEPLPTNRRGLKRTGNETLYRWLRAVEEATRNGLLFRGGLWVALAIAVGAVAWMRRRWLAFWVAASGVLYILSFLPLASSADFRYVYWTLLSFFAGAILLRTDDAPPAGVTPGR